MEIFPECVSFSTVFKYALVRNWKRARAITLHALAHDFTINITYSRNRRLREYIISMISPNLVPNKAGFDLTPRYFQWSPAFAVETALGRSPMI